MSNNPHYEDENKWGTDERNRKSFNDFCVLFWSCWNSWIGRVAWNGIHMIFCANMQSKWQAPPHMETDCSQTLRGGNSVSPACWTEKGTSGQVNQMGHNGPSKSIKCMVEERLKWYDPLFTSFHLQGTFNLQVTSMESYTCNCTNLILADAIKWIQRMQKINTARLCGSCLGFLHVLPSFLL